MNNTDTENPDFDAIFHTAGSAWHSDRKDEAIAILRDALTRYPDWTQGYSQLGRYLDITHQRSEAVRVYEHYLSLEPLDVDVACLLADLYQSLDSGNKALALYRASIEKHHTAGDNNPECLRLHNCFGMALSHLGQTREAIKEFRYVLSIDAEDDFASEWLASELREVGEFEEALALYRVLLEDRPDDTSIHWNYAYALEEAGFPDQAIEELRLILRLLSEVTAEDEEWAHLEKFHAKGFLGTLLAKRGETEEGLILLRDAVKCTPKDGQWHWELGNLLASLGQANEALTEWQVAAASENTYYAELAQALLNQTQKVSL